MFRDLFSAEFYAGEAARFAFVHCCSLADVLSAFANVLFHAVDAGWPCVHSYICFCVLHACIISA